jgi:DNA-binding beta-propeller fold protein YncE
MLPALLAAAAIAVVPDTAIHHYPLKGAPFGLVPSHDGHYLFVATAKGERGLGAYDIGDGGLTRTGFVPLDGLPADIALTPDERLAVVAAGEHVYFVDTARLIAGGNDAVLGHMDLSEASINAVVSPDGHFAFVAEERDGVVTVIDLDKAKAGHFARSAVVGRIPVGNAPVGMTFSRDGQWLYVTVEVAAAGLGWPAACDAEVGGGRHAQGAVMTLRAATAETGGSHAVVGVAAAECSAVRIRLGDDGATAYVTARGSGDVVALDTAQLPDVMIRKAVTAAPVGPSPVGIAVDGGRLFIALSNRFDRGAGTSSVMVADARTLTVTDRIPAGVFPREVAVTPDRRWLFISNFGSNDLEQVDLNQVERPAAP